MFFSMFKKEKPHPNEQYGTTLNVEVPSVIRCESTPVSLCRSRSRRRTFDALNIEGRFKCSSSESKLHAHHMYSKHFSHAFIGFPANRLKKLKNSEKLGSYRRESKYFAETTTMHGPLRVHQGKGVSFCFWSGMLLANTIFLSLQIFSLIQMYMTRTTLSEVSFKIQNEGVEFPIVTICNFNPAKKTYIEKLNATGQFSALLLDYILESSIEAPALYSSSNRSELQRGEAALELYRQLHPSFNIANFFSDSGFDCVDVFKTCTFGGREFDCCSLVKPVLTNMGKCHSLDIRSSGKEWMQKQIAAGVNAGLQLILDSNLNEQFLTEYGPMYSTSFENGYRYYVHDQNTIPYLASEGISVSPGTRVYSALTASKYDLLPVSEWGNCTNKWPSDHQTSLPYTAASCKASYRAKLFFTECGCSPASYDIEDIYPVCSPLQTIHCIDKYMRKNKSDYDTFEIPRCEHCKIECSSNVYQAFNSYGQQLSAGSIRWLHRKNTNWSMEHIKSNFLIVNVFFRDLAHTQYTQVRATTFTELLSNIGGNMGMFFGSSIITIAEIILYFCKLAWIAISRRRSKYMAEKEKREEEHSKEVEETLEEFKRIKSSRDFGKLNCCSSDPNMSRKSVPIFTLSVPTSEEIEGKQEDHLPPFFEDKYQDHPSGI